MREYETYIPISILTERFTDSEWLYDTISNTVKNYDFKKYNATQFYNQVMVDIFGNTKFYHIFDDFYNIPVYYKIEISNRSNIIASTKFGFDNNSINNIIVNLIVPSKPMVNIISELDSIIGHEINHISQRIKQYKNKLYAPLNSKESDLIKYSNDNHYITYDKNMTNLINYYFLNIREFDSHSYTYGMRLWHQFGLESKKVLALLYYTLYRDDYNPSIDLTYKNKIIDIETVLGLYNFANSFKNSEKHNKLKNSMTSNQLWKKLFKEIYKYIDTRIKL